MYFFVFILCPTFTLLDLFIAVKGNAPVSGMAEMTRKIMKEFGDPRALGTNRDIHVGLDLWGNNHAYSESGVVFIRKNKSI